MTATEWDFGRELAAWGPASGGREPPGLPQARAYCARVAKSHYENFLVASALLPRRLVRHFHAVYAYCRWSDDLADETAGGAEALALIDWWRGELLTCYGGRPRHPVMVALGETVRRFRIPPEPFLNLLVAFEQDQRVKHYDTHEQLLGYCRNSANPVGRLVLYLCGYSDPERQQLSDATCTALQLANFWQDVYVDYGKGRIYLPLEDLRQFGVTGDDIAQRRATPPFLELMKFEVERAREWFARGLPLVKMVSKELAIDIELFSRGGQEILNAIERQGFDVLKARPAISKSRKLLLVARAAAGKLVFRR